MSKLVIECTEDGKSLGRYEFDCTAVVAPTKSVGGPITIYFTPTNDNGHKMEISCLPPYNSKTIKGK